MAFSHLYLLGFRAFEYAEKTWICFGVNTNVQQLLRLLKSQPLMGGSELRPVGILYHVIRVALGEMKRGTAGKESLRPEKKEKLS